MTQKLWFTPDDLTDFDTAISRNVDPSLVVFILQELYERFGGVVPDNWELIGVEYNPYDPNFPGPSPQNPGIAARLTIQVVPRLEGQDNVGSLFVGASFLATPYQPVRLKDSRI